MQVTDQSWSWNANYGIHITCWQGSSGPLATFMMTGNTSPKWPLDCHPGTSVNNRGHHTWWSIILFPTTMAFWMYDTHTHTHIYIYIYLDMSRLRLDYVKICQTNAPDPTSSYLNAPDPTKPSTGCWALLPSDDAQHAYQAQQPVKLILAPQCRHQMTCAVSVGCRVGITMSWAPSVWLGMVKIYQHIPTIELVISGMVYDIVIPTLHHYIIYPLAI